MDSDYSDYDDLPGNIFIFNSNNNWKILKILFLK